MLKKLGLPIIALAALMAFAAPQKADARVRFGISFGAPVYTAPVPVAPYVYGYSYPAYQVDPYAYGNGYVAPAPYVDPYVAPVAPYYGGFERPAAFGSKLLPCDASGVTCRLSGAFMRHSSCTRSRWAASSRGCRRSSAASESPKALSALL